MQRTILSLGILCLSFGAMVSQGNTISVSVIVQPPYSPYFEDYIIYENKATIILTGMPNPTQEPYEVYLKARVQGDNGVLILTKEGTKPVTPIIVPAGGTTILQGGDLQDYFSLANVDYEGVTVDDILFGDGLPEGNYSICIQAFDYSTETAFSLPEPAGCSAVFSILHVDPPYIMTPFCSQEVIAQNPQHMVITWTQPVGVMGVEYLLSITELFEGQDPNEAVLSSPFPPFFETTTMSPNYIYSFADPDLEPGKSYVIQVQVIDPAGKVVFKNEGRSEVCVFHYRQHLFPPVLSESPAITTIFLPPVPPSGYFEPPGMYGSPIIEFPNPLLPTQLCGILQYTYPDYKAGDKSWPLSLANISLEVAYYVNGIGFISSSNIENSALISEPKQGFVVATGTTDAQGHYCFDFITNIETGPVGLYVPSTVKMFYPVEIQRVYRIQVHKPHADYWQSLSRDFAIVQPGEQVNKNMTALVRSYELKVNLKKNLLGGELTSLVSGESITSANVFLLRKNLNPGGDALTQGIMDMMYPREDGWPDDPEGKDTYVKIPDGFTVVGRTDINPKGIATFKRVVWHHNNNFAYFLYAAPYQDPQPVSDYFTEKPPTWVDPDLVFYPGGNKSPGPGILIQTGYADASNSRNLFENEPKGIKNILLTPKYPRVYGTVVDQDGKIPIGGVKIEILEIYTLLKGSVPYFSWQKPLLDYRAPISNEILVALGQNAWIKRIVSFGTPPSGSYKAIGLPLIMNKDTKLHEGPGRVLIFSKKGYQTKIVAVQEKLKIGDQVHKEIVMEKGAEINGVVVDAETNMPVGNATVFFKGENGTHTKTDGTFAGYDALLIPGSKQLLMVTHENYILDTFEIIIDQKKQSVGTLKIYRKAHRLAVFVRDAESGNPISNALVTLPEISAPCSSQPSNDPQPPLVGASGNCVATGRSSANWGLVTFRYLSNAALTKVVVTYPDGDQNYEAVSTQIVVPEFNTGYTLLVVKMKRASCLKGKVVVGNSPIPDATVKMNVTQPIFWGQLNIGNLNVETKSSGEYAMYNVPVRNYPQTVLAGKTKSNFVGDKEDLLFQLPLNRNVCVHQDFDLTVYNGMDISHLLGFPIQVMELTQAEDGLSAVISGSVTQILSNNQFAPDGKQELKFNQIKIVPGLIPPGDSIPASKPATLPVQTDALHFGLVAKGLKAEIYAPNETVQLNESGQGHGQIVGKVLIKNSSLGFANPKLPSVYLANDQGQVRIPVLSSNSADKTLHPKIQLCDSQGANLKYKLFDFQQVEADHTKSWLGDATLILYSNLHTQIPEIDPPDLNMMLGEITIKQNGLQALSGSQNLSTKMGTWMLSSNGWKLDDSGLQLNLGTIQAGLQIGFEKIIVKSNSLDFSQAKFSAADLKMLGVKPVDIAGDKLSMSQIISPGNKKIFQFVIDISPGKPYAAQITNLPGFRPTDVLRFEYIRIQSDGNQSWQLQPVNALLRDIMPFVTNGVTTMGVNTLSFGMTGSLKTGYPLVSQLQTNLSFEKTSVGLAFFLTKTEPVSFIKNKLHTFLDQIDIQPKKFIAEGTVEEPGIFPKTKVRLTHTAQKVQIDIKEQEKIAISGANYFDDLIGEMHVAGNDWSTFWFEGEPKGMKGISRDKLSEPAPRMKFTVNGAVKADGQSLSVDRIQTPFGQMEFTYLLPESRMIGSCNFNKELIGGLLTQATVESVVDGNGWYFKAGGNINLPGLGAGNLFALLGDYSAVPPTVQKGFGSYSCLPSGFKNSISGFLVSGGIKKEILPTINYNFVLVGVSAGLDIDFAGRFYTLFSEQGNNYNLNVKAEGHAFANGSSPLTCTTVGFDAKAVLGFSANYNSGSKTFSLAGCAGISAGISGSQCVGLAGICVSDPCLTVDVGGLELGLELKADSSQGLHDVKLKWETCNFCN